MKASDLPYDVKQQFLDQIKKQVGSTEYHKMVDSIGEDGLVDLAIENLKGAKDQPEQKGFWDRFGCLIVLLVGVGVFFIWGWEGVGTLVAISLPWSVPWILGLIGEAWRSATRS